MFERLGVPGNFNGVKFHPEGSTRILPGEEPLPYPHDCHAELFAELPREGFLERLARLDLATRKLPEPPMSFMLRPTADEVVLATPDDGGYDRGTGGCDMVHGDAISPKSEPRSPVPNSLGQTFGGRKCASEAGSATTGGVSEPAFTPVKRRAAPEHPGGEGWERGGAATGECLV